MRAWDRDIDFSDILLDQKLYRRKIQKYFNFIQSFNGCKTIAF